MKDMNLELEKLNQRLGAVKAMIKITEQENETSGIAMKEVNEISLEFYREEKRDLEEKIAILNAAQEILLGIR